MMKKLLLINSSINSTSTGRIAEEIGIEAAKNEFGVMAAYGFTNNNSKHGTIKIGSTLDQYRHALLTRLTDRHGLGSSAATKKFIKQLKAFKPDIVNIHNIHGYYLNYPILIDYLKSTGIPVVWTLHDCWPFTGHCSYFDAVNCERWKTGCFSCPNKKGYPSSAFIDRSGKNYALKKELFASLPNLTMVAPCEWMANNVRNSFLGDKDIRVIYNGVDLNQFLPSDSLRKDSLRKKIGLEGYKIILGVASVWDKRKGLDDFKKMAGLLHDDERIVLIGLSDEQIAGLPQNVIGVKRTENVAQLADFYSLADVFANPTYVDNFPTTNIEALACGTPVVTYRTGGSPEAIDENAGRIVEKGDYKAMLEEIRKILNWDSFDLQSNCRKRAEEKFDSRERFKDYVELFKELCITTH